MGERLLRPSSFWAQATQHTAGPRFFLCLGSGCKIRNIRTTSTPLQEGVHRWPLEILKIDQNEDLAENLICRERGAGRSVACNVSSNLLDSNT